MTDSKNHPPHRETAAFLQAEQALRNGRPLPVRTVLRLQRTIGNREVGRLLTPRLPAPPAAPTEVQALPMVIPAPAPPLQQRLTAAWTRLLPHKPVRKE
jgi:hypothetical protein